MDSRIPCDAATLRAWLVTYIGSVIGLPDRVPTDQPFESYGFDSFEIVVMAGVLEEEFGVPVDSARIFETPSIDGVVAAFADGDGAPFAEDAP
jgi:acyl carrier protein